MSKENDILNSDFIDFEITVVPEPDSTINSYAENFLPDTLVAYENTEEIPEFEQLLKNMLKAAKIDMDSQVLLVKTTPRNHYSFADLKRKWPLKDFLFFGVNPQKFGINYQLVKYQINQQNGNRFLLIDSLHSIYAEKAKKSKPISRAAWNCLQEMYLK